MFEDEEEMAAALAAWSEQAAGGAYVYVYACIYVYDSMHRIRHACS